MLYLVRHGKTSLNADAEDDRIRGWKDVPLDSTGIDEAHDVAHTLEGKGIKRIFTSDLQRAKTTADILGKKIGIEPEESDYFRPWNLGDFQGKLTKEVLPQIAHYIDHEHAVVPNGESFATFKNRFLMGMKGVQRMDGPSAIVTHYRNLSLAHAWIKNGMKGTSIDKDLMKKKFDIEPGHILQLSTKAQ